MNWFKKCPLFDMGLDKLTVPFRKMEFRGVATIDGIFIPKGLMGNGEPQKDTYVGNRLFTSCIFDASDFDPMSRVYFKMIENLKEVLAVTAGGGDARIDLLKKDAFYINGFRPLDQDESDFYPIGKIYAFEKENPERFGVAFEQVTMDSSGDINVLPNNHRLFQMIGFGNSYLEAVSGATELLSVCQENINFDTRKQETLENIRDRVVFVESWFGEKNEDRDENS
jgi:hypothetical protein